ncbi:MAG: deoxyribodipyrimidine photo-lyase [Microbacteriaceae bacterium]
MTALVWLRNDLRLADNPALRAAVDRDEPVVVLYVLDDETVRPLGGASRWWLHHSLQQLGERLAERGGALVLRRGAAPEVVPAVAEEIGADVVLWNRRYGKAGREADAGLKDSLRESGLEVESFQANLLFEPWTIRTGQGNPFQVFTPFWKACLGEPEPRSPLPEPREVRAPAKAPASDPLDDWGLLPTKPDWAGGLRETWTPGELDARKRLDRFAEEVLQDYGLRDEPAQEAGSRLSPSLSFGEISPFQVWERLRRDLSPEARREKAKFLSEIGWREFHHHVMFHSEDYATINWRSNFDDFPWEQPDAAELERWQQGRTGIPLVDAGMRELWTTGFMHNRVRMVAASFLIKNLLVDWRVGEQWFWDTLVDADGASNPGNWQWVAGSGADAAPYFRIFNPVTQAEKFDKDRNYLRQWIPELDTDEYPEPMVDLKESRQAALDAYEMVKKR